jgi:hypothetical protein
MNWLRATLLAAVVAISFSGFAMDDLIALRF